MNFTYRFLTGFILLLSVNQVLAQFSETIASSRPGATYTPFTTGKSVFQIQTGFIYDSNKDTSIDYTRNGFSYTLLGRYGIAESFEIRTTAVLRTDNVTSSGSESSYGGFSLLDFGFRWNIIDGVESGTSLGLQSEFRMDVGPDEYRPQRQFANRTMALFTTPITDWLAFSTNLGVSWYDGSGATGLYTLNLGFPITSNLGGFIEMFGSFTGVTFTKSFDTGIGYLVNNNLLIDFSLGFNERIQSNFFDLGLSWRLPKK